MAGLNIVQMHRAIRLGLQQVDANAFDGFQPEELDVYINEVINEYVKAQFSMLKKEEYTAIDEGVLENLRTLLVVQNYPVVAQDSEIIPDAKVVELPEANASPSPVPGEPTMGYYYYIHGHIKVNGELRTTRLSSFYHLRNYLHTESNFPVLRRVPLIIKDQQIHILREMDTDELTDFVFSYIREPVLVDKAAGVSCDLPPHTHYEIVDHVIRRVTRDILQQRIPQQEQPEA